MISLRHSLTTLLVLQTGSLAALAQCELAKLLAADGYSNDRFGTSVSLSGDRLAVGAPGADSAYVYRHEAGTWTREAQLVARGGPGAEFGVSVQIDGMRLIGGGLFYSDCPGDINDDGYVNQQDLGSFLSDWGCVGNECVGDLDGDGQTGQSDLGILLAHWDEECPHGLGAAFVYGWNGSSWEREAMLEAHDGIAWDFFGESVAIRGDRAVVGAPEHFGDGSWTGSAYVFRRQGATWVQEAKLVPGASSPGARFGTACSMTDDWIVVGATGDDDGGSAAGAAHVFRRDDSGTPGDPSDDSWIEHAKLLAGDGDERDLFGTSLAISGDYVAVGADGDDPVDEQSGSAYAFRRDDNGTPEDLADDTWTEQAKLVPSDGQRYNYFGTSVSLVGDIIVAGARNHLHDGQPGGAAYVFERDDNGTPSDPADDLWIEVMELMAGDAASGDSFGIGVWIDADQVLVGAFEDDDNGWNSGSAYVFDLGGEDCNENGICDSRDIADGTSYDENGNGIPDECECAGDLDNDGDTDQSDLGILLSDWGCDDPVNGCPGDLNADDKTGQADLGILLADWGCEH